MLSQEQLQQERVQLDEDWTKLRAERASFEEERRESGLEFKLFIGNLDETTNEEEIRALFGGYGELKEVVMLKGRDGKSKRSCFVKYFTKASAEASLEALNGKHKDKESPTMLVVRYARDKPQNTGGGFQQSQQYGGQQQQYGQQQFGMGGGFQQNGFGGQQQDSYGGQQTSYSQGAAGVGVAGAAAGSGGFGRGPSGANLYINNLSRQATEADVQTMFGDFGRVLSVKLFGDQGYGFVSFDNLQSAQNAISCLNGLAMGVEDGSDGSKRLEVSIKKDRGAGGGGGSRFTPY